MFKGNLPKGLLALAALAAFALAGHAPLRAQTTPAGKRNFKFSFGPGKLEPGYTQVLPDTPYTAELGYGFEKGAAVSGVDRGTPDALRAHFCTSDKPFFFSIALPEGNYTVTVTLGDAKDKSVTTVKSELRRLSLEKVQTAPGEFAKRTFTVSVRQPQISTGGAVKLKGRETTSEFFNWDNKLSLEFNDARPCLCALDIAPADKLPTVYLLGDSTVCDQPLEPWNSWGQMLPRFFKSDVVISNHAESGETIKSSLGAKRLDKVLSTMKAGDYLFLQFGHNDMKSRTPDAVAIYKADLKRIIAQTRQRQATPVLVTSMNRRTFGPDGKVTNSLKAYTDAVLEVAQAEKTAVIDLNAMSKTFYEALGGAEPAKKAFVDGTHHNSYGSYELAKCIVIGIRQNKLALAASINDDFKDFDPAHPDPLAAFAMPPSPMSDPTVKPEGN